MIEMEPKSREQQRTMGPKCPVKLHEVELQVGRRPVSLHAPEKRQENTSKQMHLLNLVILLITIVIITTKLQFAPVAATDTGADGTHPSQTIHLQRQATPSSLDHQLANSANVNDNARINSDTSKKFGDHRTQTESPSPANLHQEQSESESEQRVAQREINKSNDFANMEIGGRSMAQTDARSAEDEQPLHQLQLPLQLHLKLRPLPLPLPPPPPPSSQHHHTIDRRAQTPSEPSGPQSSQTTTTTAAPPTTTTERPGSKRKSTRSIDSQVEREKNAVGHQVSRVGGVVDLQQVSRDSATWREAKRVLLLNSNPSVSQRMDRRTMALADPTLALGSQPSYSRMSLQPYALISDHKTPMAQNETRRAALTRDYQLMLAQADQLDQFKQQQQQQQQQASRVTRPASSREVSTGPDSAAGQQQLQALTAALLPLIWPSNLSVQPGASSAARQERAAQANRTAPNLRPDTQRVNFELVKLDDATASLLSYSTPLERQRKSNDDATIHDQAIKVIEPPKELARREQEQELESSNAITVQPVQASDPNANNKTIGLGHLEPSLAHNPRQARRKRKKPAYLQHASSSTTPYPDSFRMASKYPMPKIKYLHNGNQQVDSARAITRKRLAAKQHRQQQQQQLQKNHNNQNKHSTKKKKVVNYQPFEPTSLSHQLGTNFGVENNGGKQRSLNDDGTINTSSASFNAKPVPIVEPASKATTGDQWQSMSVSSLPKSLSKLIEEKFLGNSNQNSMSNLLQNLTSAYKNSASHFKLNAPTTSVSRVVGVIGSARQIVGASKQLGEAAQSQSPERMAEAAITIASAASDAWKQSNLTLEDLSSLVLPNSWTTNQNKTNNNNNNNSTSFASKSDGGLQITTTPVPIADQTTVAPPIRSSMQSNASSTAARVNSTESYESKVVPTPIFEQPATRQTEPAAATTTTTSTSSSTTESPARVGPSSGKLRDLDGEEDEDEDDEPADEKPGEGVLAERSLSKSSTRLAGESLPGEPRASPKANKRTSSLPESPPSTSPLKSKRRRENARFGSAAAAAAANKQQLNIKLFHFKRKPDLNKLPFYKKPLNYTELGWSQEQIQEHLDGLAALGLPAGNSGEPAAANQQQQQAAAEGAPADHPIQSAKAAELSESDRRELQQQSDYNQQESARQQLQLQLEQVQRNREDQQQDKFLLLKRKRRGGRNQFERLMADLHSGTSSGQSQSQLVQAESEPVQTDGSPETTGELVPVLKKKIESLVMKPIFTHAMLNQSRLANQLNKQPTTTQSPESISSRRSDEANILSESDTEANGTKPAASKPIIRMRRKNSLDQSPVASRNQANSSGWKPIGPVPDSPASARPQASTSAASEQLMLVPSGLLTPSGSHLIPLIARPPQWPSSAELGVDPEAHSHNHKLLNQFFSWQPARSSNVAPSLKQQQPHLHASNMELDVPSSLINGADGLISSMEQMQPPVASPPQDSSTAQAKQQAVPNSSSGSQPPPASSGEQFRVPKLLVKPMRPAKYSLNGYIPKPSLSHNIESGAGNQPGASPTLKAQQQPPQSPHQHQHHSKQQAASPSQMTSQSAASRDLDSSTSNEIFSRRRGLNNHSHNNNIQNSNNSDQQHKLQLEENKKKYLLQSQQSSHLATSPTLSAHKANLIKAKLGLIPSATTKTKTTRQRNAEEREEDSGSSNNPSSPLSNRNRLGSLAGQASTNSISHMNAPLAFGESAQRQPAASKEEGQQTGATPPGPNGIPKTDFECTDKSGKFVSGLFADYKTNCQVWHLCSNNRKYSFLCPAGTVFNSKARICDWRYNVKCDAESTLPRFIEAKDD